MIGDLNLNRIDKQRYRPAADVEDTLDDLRRNLVTGEKYRVARLAIARSLVEPIEIELLPRGTEMGNSIEGQTLLGDESAVWSCLIVESCSRLITSVEEFRAVLEAHWSRGARLLQTDLEHADMRSADFITTLASMARHATGEGGESTDPNQRSGTVSVKFGDLSQDVRTEVEVSVQINALGVSPHIAILGRKGSGKTSTGLIAAEQITENSQIPLLVIDPRGEFVHKGQFVRKPEWGNRTLADRIPDIQAIDIPTNAVPLDFLYRTPTSQPIELAQISMAFRDSVQKSLRTKGDVSFDSFRAVVQELLAMNRGPVSLDTIRDAVRSANEASGRGKDAIEAKLNDLCALRLFEPTMTPHEFFSRRWVVSLGGASDESRRLVMFALLDALTKYLFSLRDSDTDKDGARALRHLLVLDDAKEILLSRHSTLASLVRKSAPKGEVVIVTSLSPDDFEHEDEDFLTQVGSLIVFASTTNSVKNLRNVFGRRLAPENFSEKDLPRGVAWAKLPNTELFKIRAWR